MLTIRLNVTHKAGAPLGLSGGQVQRCEYCGELLWDSNMRAAGNQFDGPYKPGEYVVFKVVITGEGVDGDAPPAELHVGVDVPEGGKYEPGCIAGFADSAGNVLRARSAREEVCATCRKGHEPKLLDRDGVVWGVSGAPSVWAHASGDEWWPCAGVRVSGAGAQS